VVTSKGDQREKDPQRGGGARSCIIQAKREEYNRGNGKKGKSTIKRKTALEDLPCPFWDQENEDLCPKNLTNGRVAIEITWLEGRKKAGDRLYRSELFFVTRGRTTRKPVDSEGMGKVNRSDNGGNFKDFYEVPEGLVRAPPKFQKAVGTQ